jgi:hypothetical protein
MSEILIINDGSSGARAAADYACLLALASQKNLLLAHTRTTGIKVNDHMLVTVQDGALDDEPAEDPVHGIEHYLASHLGHEKGFRPQFKSVDFSGFSEGDLAAYVNRNDVYLVVHAVSADQAHGSHRLDIQGLINKVRCPVALVPAGCPLHAPGRMVYLTDLRYCQPRIVNVLQQLNRQSSSLHVAHICLEGLVDLAAGYAAELFRKLLRHNDGSDRLSFTHIKERDVKRAADIIINTLGADLLVCINRQFHFQELFGQKITAALPECISIPVLVFPS